MISEAVVKAIAVTAELMNKNLSKDAVVVLATELSQYREQLVLAALTRCRRELKFFPSLSEILSKMEDGRPGAEEAWAMMPKNEDASVVWTDEMCEAFAVARPLLLEGDPIAARMAFKEAYSKIVSDKRGTPVRWQFSPGMSKSGREAALQEAVHKGRLALEDARHIMPELEFSESKKPALPGPAKQIGFNSMADTIKQIMETKKE